MTMLRAGAATVDITPDWSISMAGFGLRDHSSEGVAHPLHLRLVVLESESETGETSRVAIASADFLWWGAEYVDFFRTEISLITGAPTGSILLTASHTHSGPQTSSIPNGIGLFDQNFHDLLAAAVNQAATEAVAKLEPVTISRFAGNHDLAFNRRYRFNPNGPVDRELIVIRFDRLDGTPASLLVHYTCHPTIYQGYQLSSEYCGVAMSALEAELGATSLFLQGCCGDINPDLNRDGVQVRGGTDVVEREGALFARSVSNLIESGGELLEPIPLQSIESIVDLPYSALPTIDELEAGKDESGAIGEWRRGLLEHPERLSPSIPLHLQRLDLARDCSLLTMNGEICVEYGQHVREISGGSVLPLGYANGMTGYVPTARIIEEGGYEAGESIPYFGLPAPFAPEVEPILKNALSELIAEDTGEFTS